MKQKIYLLTFLISLTTIAFAQTNRHQTYLSNIVGIGNQDFGFIIGAAPGHIFFITADKENAPPTNRYVRFYGEKGDFMPQYMTSFNFKNIHVRLYDVATDNKVKWVPNSYSIKKKQLAPYRSFLSDDKDLNNWFASSAIFESNSEEGSILQLRAAKGNSFFRGMPVVDNNNTVVGLIADKQEYVGPDATILTIINMSDIADKIYNATGCKNFQLIEYGQPTTRCNTEAAEAAKTKALLEQAKRNSSLHALAFGPAFSAAIPNVSDQGDGGNSGGSAFGLGVNLETWPDQGKFRIVLKPRINWVNFNLNGNSTPKSAIGFQATKFNLTTFEMPVMFEFLFSRSIGGNNYWSIGYAPGYQTDISYSYKTTAHQDVQKATASGTSTITHKVMATIGAEFGNTRIELFAGYQLSNWHNPVTYTIDKYPVNPFDGVSQNYFLIGLDLSFRLGSPWGLKSVETH